MISSIFIPSSSTSSHHSSYPFSDLDLHLSKLTIRKINSLSQATASSSSRSSTSSSSGGRKEKEGHKSRKLLTSSQELRNILSNRYYCSSVTFRHYDEIVSGLYLGDMKTARNVLNLEKMGVTHIVNMAYAPSPFTDRELSQTYYEEHNFPCSFLGIPAQDFPSWKIGIYFDETTNFINEALKGGGRVLVHCQVGVSRSASIVIAYLMMKRKMSAKEAVTYVGAIRPIFPNEGFLKQICELEYKLKHPKNVLVRSLSAVSRRTFRKVFNKN